MSRGLLSLIPLTHLRHIPYGVRFGPPSYSALLIFPLGNPANFLRRFLCFATGSDRFVRAGIGTKLLLYVASIGPVGVL
jgi:hypothetical protein